MQKRTQARIFPANITDNYKYLKTLLPDKCEIMGVIKADAYGHGALEVATVLQRCGVGSFCVASLDEALDLRRGGIYSDILILGHVSRREAYTVCDYGLIATAVSYEQARDLASATHGGLRLHIKLDTGMTRNGIYCHDENDVQAVADECECICAIENACVEGIYTHFSCAEDDPQFTKHQFSLFMGVCNELDARGVKYGKRHCCNSAGILLYPEYHLDMVRAGIALYGYSPSPELEVPQLKKCMVLESRVDQIKDIRSGDSVGYGRAYIAEKDMRIAVVSIGYGDGYSRLLSNKDKLYLNGVYVPVIGRICMDACMVDVTNIPCNVGDTVTVFGTNRKGADTMAELMGTICYEVLCDVGKRVPREYCER